MSFPLENKPSAHGRKGGTARPVRDDVAEGRGESYAHGYREIARKVGAEDLHSLIAAKGLEVLEQPLPYVVHAARWEAGRARQREHRRQILESSPMLQAATAEHVAIVRSCWDPYEQATRTEALGRLVSALAQLRDGDVFVLWRHAEGFSDQEILAEWPRQKFRENAPSSLETLRKRRQRALIQVRRLLAAAS